MDGSYLCPECNFPLCGEMCAYGGEHADRECKVFSRVEPKIEIKDFTKEETWRGIQFNNGEFLLGLMKYYDMCFILVQIEVSQTDELNVCLMQPTHARRTRSTGT